MESRIGRRGGAGDSGREATPGMAFRLLAARGLRAAAYGLQSVLLGLYLDASGFRPEQVGWMLTATLVGSAGLTAVLGAHADRWGRRRSLVVGCVITAAGALTFAASDSVGLWTAAALAGTIFSGAGEVGPLETVDSAILPQAAPAEGRNRLFGWYSTLGALGVALGALAAGGAVFISPVSLGYRVGFAASAALILVSAVPLLGLSSAAETQTSSRSVAGLQRSRPVVFRLSALFALDALAGGFVVQGFIVYWFHQRFGVGADVLGPTFFAVNLMKAVSYPVAARLADRFGLLPTMVFTHLPSNLLLFALPLAPGLEAAITILILRHALAQMDVPTRTSYLVGIVDPEERTAAVSLTTLVRMLSHAVSPSLAGRVWQAASAVAPFWIGGGLKIVYDVLLYVGFRKVHPSSGH